MYVYVYIMLFIPLLLFSPLSSIKYCVLILPVFQLCKEIGSLSPEDVFYLLAKIWSYCCQLIFGNSMMIGFDNFF